MILAEIAKNLTNSTNICTAGGSFLNCNANEKILYSGLFDKCYFVPPADDSGIPLGCAWYAYDSMIDIEDTKILSPYLGKKYDEKEIIAALNENSNLHYRRFDDFEDLIDEVSHWLSENRVIGWFQDGSEIGPRALGNRSIICKPTDRNTHRLLNEKYHYNNLWKSYEILKEFNNMKK